MSQPLLHERRLLDDAEFEAVAASHYPGLAELDRAALVALAQRLRGLRDKARDIAHQQRRAARGKPGPTPAGSVPGAQRITAKKQLFAAALRRLNPRIAQLDAEAKRARTTKLLAAALARKQASAPHHPQAGAHAAGGMRATPSRKRGTRIDPRTVGSISQATRNAQARRDAR